MTRKRNLAIALALIVVIAEVGLLARIGHAHHVANDNRAALDRTRRAFSGVESNYADTQAALARTSREATVRSGEAQEAQDAQDRDTALLATATHNLAAANSTIAATAASLAAIDACVNSSKKATAQRNAGDLGAAIATLKTAQPVCTSLTSPGDHEAATFPFDFSDPSVLVVGNTYYAYSTNSAMGDLPVISSTDLTHWTIVGNALPWLPKWAIPGATWAPAVIGLGGRYVAYYTVRAAADWVQCISVAVSASPAGPFVDRSTKPLVCEHDRGGSIDPQPFVDRNGHPSLIWKGERRGGRAAVIWSQALRPDGLALTGQPSTLITADQAWEHGVVEAPSLAYTNGGLSLFYSGNSWNSADYALGEAHCAAPAGPCWKPHNDPVFASHGSVAGPGSATVFTSTTGQLWLVYNAFNAAHVGYPASRLLHVGRVNVDGDAVTVTAP